MISSGLPDAARQWFHVRLVVAASICFASALPALATDFPVSSAADITAALSMAQPGDSLVMSNGVWNNQQIQFAGMGTSANPITLRAETPGGVTLTGNSSLNISGDWLVADGLRFDGGALGANDHVVEFRGNLGEATNSRFTNSAIINYNPADINTRYFWVSMYGQNNRVDHNFFQGQNHSGVTVVVWRNSSNADFHQIDNNHFADRPIGNGNGFETIRVGTSAESLSDSFTTVENNLFERVDGEIEIISNKSGNNTYRYNTFRESAGTLTLRHGNDTLVEGNFFLGEGANSSGGVRVIGERQTIVNNYFANLDGRADGAISISAGVPNSANNEYFQVKDAVIAHNTIVDVNEAAITFDHGFGSSGRTLLAEDVTIANNLIRSTQDPLFEGTEGANWNWEGNIAWGQSLGPAAGNPGIQVVDPILSIGSDLLWRPASGSPAINGGSGNYAGLISDDMDGQFRNGLFDVGADEFSTDTIVRRPFESGDVGPDWLGGDDPIDVSCGTGCVAMQAEDFSAVLDTNGDGRVWFVTSSADSLGGQSIQAPLGDRVDLPNDPHDTLAVYDVEFADEGTYTAYYRARGFDSGTDSIFTPDGFDTDPTVNTSLSSDGSYEWEAVGAFDVTASHIGVPLQLRIGRREQLAELDAIVLHLNGSLTSVELDAIFLAPDADFNDDGSLDCADVDALVAEIASASMNASFDLNADGMLDAADLTQWLADAGAANLPSGNPYLPADANLDGNVDGQDFLVWNDNKFQTIASFCSGDFNADGAIDGQDFVTWNDHKFTSADSVAHVPEPGLGSCLAWLLCLLAANQFSRRSNSIPAQ